MDRDRIEGKMKETIGKAEAEFGDFASDPETQASGRVRQATGAAQDLYGQTTDALVDAAGSADKVINTLTSQVKAQP